MALRAQNTGVPFSRKLKTRTTLDSCEAAWMLAFCSNHELLMVYLFVARISCSVPNRCRLVYLFVDSSTERASYPQFIHNNLWINLSSTIIWLPTIIIRLLFLTWKTVVYQNVAKGCNKKVHHHFLAKKSYLVHFSQKVCRSVDKLVDNLFVSCGLCGMRREIHGIPFMS